jgi:hypothetical protein
MMPSSVAGARVVRAATGLLVCVAAYHLAVRPRLLRWGADAREVAQALPGDDRIIEPEIVSTRAISVAAEPSDIWPWLAQLGDGRGGLYSYDCLDMLFGYLQEPSADVVLPEYQDLAPGDEIPLGRGPDWPVIFVKPERALVVQPAGAEVTWCWAIIPVDDSTTRLLSRVRLRVGTRLPLWTLAPVIDLPWFLMERRMLHGIARRAETLARSRRKDS